MVRHRPVLAADSARVYLKAVSDVLQEAAGASASKEAVDLLASVLMAAMDGFVVQWASHRDRLQAEAHVEAFCAGIPALCRHVVT
jgi:TetR/AcrR family transcriptional regulator, regulator of biofilm formation and stress response